MKTDVIIVAAGAGTRLGAKLPKALVGLKGKPMVNWSLKAFEDCSLVDEVVLVAPKSHLKEFKQIALGFSKVTAVVLGGAQRADSVRLGLKAIADQTRLVLVHDAARPMIDVLSIKRLLQALKTYQAAILGIPVKPTIKLVDQKSGCIGETLPRHLLWEAQTPQGFRRELLIKAHQQKIKQEATDDAFLVEKMGIKVKMVMGDPRNIKITTKEDLELACQWLKFRGRDQKG